MYCEIGLKSLREQYENNYYGRRTEIITFSCDREKRALLIIVFAARDVNEEKTVLVSSGVRVSCRAEILKTSLTE